MAARAATAEEQAERKRKMTTMLVDVTALDKMACDTAATVRELKRALRARSDRPWSVTRGRGTAYGWLTITAPPARCGKWGEMGDDDRAELGRLLNMEGPSHAQGVSVPDQTDYYRRYLRLANGLPPIPATPNWD